MLHPLQVKIKNVANVTGNAAGEVLKRLNETTAWLPEVELHGKALGRLFRMGNLLGQSVAVAKIFSEHGTKISLICFFSPPNDAIATWPGGDVPLFTR